MLEKYLNVYIIENIRNKTFSYTLKIINSMCLKSFKDLTDTANSSWVQLKIRRTVACVAARGVDTVPTDTGRWIQTLVNIYSQKKNGQNYPASSVGLASPRAVTPSLDF